MSKSRGTSHDAGTATDEGATSGHWLRLAQFSIEHATDAMFWVSHTGEILYANNATCRLLGYSRGEIIGRTVADFNPHFPRDAWPLH